MLRNEFVRWFWIIPVAILAAYYPVFQCYAYTDTYNLLWASKYSPDFLSTFYGAGRPLFGWLALTLFSNTESVCDVAYIRGFSMLGIMVFALLFARLLSRSGTDNWTVALTALLVLFSPSFGIMAGWAATFQVPWAMVLGMLGGQSMLLWVLNPTEPKAKRVWRLLGAVVLTWASFMLYQSSTMAFLIPAFVYWLYEGKKELMPYRIMGWVLGGFFAITACYFVGSKISHILLGIHAQSRGAITFDILGKLEWFVKGSLFYSLSHFSILLAPGALYIVSALVLIAIGAGLWANYRLVGKRVWSYLGVLVAFLPLSYLPSLAVNDDWVSLRTSAVLAVLLLTWAAHSLRLALPKKAGIAVLGLWAMVSGGFAWYNTSTYLADQQANEWKLFKEAVTDKLANDPQGIIIVRPPFDFYRNTQNLRHFTDEYGSPSNSRPWATLPMYNQAVYEITGNFELLEQDGVVYNEIPLVVVGPDEEIPKIRKYSTINLNKVLLGEREEESNPK